jgi:protein TonB
MVRIGRFLGEDSVMSTTVLEVRGPNKALFRTAALAGSAIIWGTLGYLALTYVPKLAPPPITLEPPSIDTVPVTPKIIDPPKPPVIKPDELKQDPILRDPISTPTPPIITTRPVPNPQSTGLPRDLPAGPPPTAPASDGLGDQGQLSVPIELPIELPKTDPIVPPLPEPVPAAPIVQKTIINPVRVSGGNPIFPSRPLDAGISGEVTLSFTVTTSGRVENLVIDRETPRNYGFGRAALEAIENWTFQPQTIDGIPVAYPARYTISFKLED